MNAEELYLLLKIQTPFKEWAATQIQAGKEFKPFFGKLADGKLGKNYTLSPELEAELVAQHREPEAELYQKIEHITLTGKDTDLSAIADTLPNVESHIRPLLRGLKNASERVKKPKKKPIQAAPRDERPFSVLSYNETILGRTLTDKEARKAGLSLAAIARNRQIEPGKVEHPVWTQVNTWPKYLLDRYYAKSLAKKANEPDGRMAGRATHAPTQSATSLTRDGLGADKPGDGNAISDALPPTRSESTHARNEAGAGSENISQG